MVAETDTSNYGVYDQPLDQLVAFIEDDCVELIEAPYGVSWIMLVVD
jgi:hypothetical protein